MTLMASIHNKVDDDIRNHRFDLLARLLRSDCPLKQSTRNLLADYFEGKRKRGRGRPKTENEYDMVLMLYEEFWLLRKYGKTQEEFNRYVACQSLGKNVIASLEGNGLSREDAIEKLADIYVMGTKNIERLIALGKKIDDYESEMMSRYLEDGA